MSGIKEIAEAAHALAMSTANSILISRDFLAHISHGKDPRVHPYYRAHVVLGTESDLSYSVTEYLEHEDERIDYH